MRIVSALVLLLSLAFPASAGPADLTVPDLDQKFTALRWQTPGARRLDEAHAALTVPPGYLMVGGADAAKAETLLGNPSLPNLEASMLNRSNHFAFQHFEEGYVSLDDWGDLHAKEMLDGISESTEKDNEVRRQAKIDELHVTGWIKEPYLDRASGTVYWAIAATEGAHQLVNFVALRLSRGGFEKITWSITKDDYAASAGTLEKVLGDLTFDPGYRYGDHVSGDKVAAYGVAGLVAAVAGIKLTQLAAGGGLVLLLKKFGAFAVVILGALAVLFRRLFGARKKGA